MSMSPLVDTSELKSMAVADVLSVDGHVAASSHEAGQVDEPRSGSCR